MLRNSGQPAEDAAPLQTHHELFSETVQVPSDAPGCKKEKGKIQNSFRQTIGNILQIEKII